MEGVKINIKVLASQLKAFNAIRDPFKSLYKKTVILLLASFRFNEKITTSGVLMYPVLFYG
ncbi:MAG: hypothetical protein H2058_12145 [Muricauda sp.]|nr:hypothetical protein [Allomuricauda sp.]MBA4745996.1 hypothetical protein [Allomuricauda sp.]